jgi:uncharacterized protein with HEPN domain
MRHILIHAYFGSDEEVVRDVVLRSAPALAAQIEAILEELE